MSSEPSFQRSSRTDYVQSVDRVFEIIRSFGSGDASRTINDISAETGLSRATTRRFLLTLVALGYVAKEGKQFALTPRILELGYAYLSSTLVSDVVQQRLERLAGDLHESCSGSVLDVPDIVYIARAATSRIMSINLSIGARLPAYVTSMGRVLLAYQDDALVDRYLAGLRWERVTDRTIRSESEFRAILASVQAQGWAVIDQELEDGVRSVAAPIRGRDGRVIAAINVSAHAGRVSLRTLSTEFRSVLQDAASDIGAQLAAQFSQTSRRSER